MQPQNVAGPATETTVNRARKGDQVGRQIKNRNNSSAPILQPPKFNDGAVTPDTRDKRAAVLRPFVAKEVFSTREAAQHSRTTPATVINWANKYSIGRLIAARWAISRIALEMLLDNDRVALKKYLAGDRTSPAVIAYYERLSVPLPERSL